MRAFWIFVIIVSATIGWFSIEPVGVQKSRIVSDISWPQCGQVVARAEQGIVGINGGLALRPNPCLAAEAANFTRLSVYVNTGYPGPSVAHIFQTGPKSCGPGDKVCLAYNYGYNAGRYAIDYSLRSGVVAKMWWLDVETENSWDKNPKVNRAALAGTLDSLKSFVGRQNLGFYSYPGQWHALTDSWHNSYPVWAATGDTRREAAESACGQPGFTGGPVLLAQYTPRLDQNVICRQ